MNKRNKRSISQIRRILLFDVILALCCVGATYAMLNSTAKAENNLSTNYSTSITETFETPKEEDWQAGLPITKRVKVSNDGESDVLVRISYAEMWKCDGSGLSNSINGEPVVKKNWADAWSTEWIDGGDGWYYYKRILTAGTSTNDILETVQLNTSLLGERDGALGQYYSGQYSLNFFVETVQASPADAVKAAWNRIPAIEGGDVSW